MRRGMMAYASRCSGRTVGLLRDAGWGFVIEPGSRPARPVDGIPYVLDNGAWGCYMRRETWQLDPFLALVVAHGAGADWVVAPDIVAGGTASLDLSMSWLPQLLNLSRMVLIAVQDGMVPNDVRGVVGQSVGIFVGGSTAWKLSSLRMWGQLAREQACHMHVGRVNTARRIRLCQDAGADSFDGTSVTRFSKTLPKLDWARRQEVLYA